MIWVASYSRWGNTYLRTVIHDCFGVFVGSQYDDFRWSDKLRSIVGYDNATEAQTDLIKTHEYATGDRKAIYVVRDGRASIVTFYHFLQIFSPNKPELDELLRGEGTQHASWSAYVKSWRHSSNSFTKCMAT
ncbi:hypothetical protein [Methyloligella solikamskensis]|uniref:Sulfotransferase domain-containing protein n=1 Tax=Methyloligella solikamskensis TaxID=1177756 RepID=A0ABW3JAD1_9HYPH